MLDYLAERTGEARLADAAELIESAVSDGFEAKAIRPMEFGRRHGNQGCHE